MGPTTAGWAPAARAVAATAVVAVTVVALGVLGPPSSAVAAEKCVGVIVDARLIGGDVRTGCAKGDPGNGLDALTRAGFRYAFVPRQPGLVCQIDELPECSRTSTTTYWSYWYREQGSDRWVYAGQGAGTRDPEPGGTEAWVWQEGGRREPPGIGLRAICPQLAAPAPEKSEAASPSSKPARTGRPTRSADAQGAATTRASKPAGGSRRTSDEPASPTPSATSAPPRASTSPSPPTSTTAGTESVAAEPTTSPVAQRSGGDDAGTPPWVGLAAGAMLAAALGTAALLRSRRTGGPP
jgi:hypothetical protein